LGAVFHGTPGISHTYDTESDYSFLVPTGKGTNLTVGLLNGLGFGTLTGSDSLTFMVTDNSNTIFADTFSSLSAATSFFSDNVLSFGALTGTNTIGIDLDLTAADPVGFQGNFLVGTAGAGGGGGAVPEPGTLAVFLTALLAWFGIGRRRPQKAGGGASMA
jgi:hypothetical protein